MAEAVVSAVVDQLVLAAADWLKEEISLLKGVKSKIQNMKIRMKSIQTVIKDAQNHSVKEENVELWLKKLQDVSYDMNDVLDEWITKPRVHMLERDGTLQNNISLPSPTAMKKLNCFSSKKLNCFSYVKQLLWLRDIAFRIKDINGRIDFVYSVMLEFKLASNVVGNDDAMNKIDLVYSEMKEFKLASKAMGNDDAMNKIIHSRVVYRNTTSTIDQPKVFGRVKDMEFLLKKTKTEHQESLQVISIVGTGGLGKTTLAQMVYNNGEVEKKFGEKRIWVCVSNPFDEVKVAKEILEGLKVDHAKMTGLQTLHQSIGESISKEKFFLVLDDVWNENRNALENLRKCLMRGHAASTILVTTRLEEVATMMGTTDSLNPQLISDSDCWSFMSQIAFQGRTSKDIVAFEDIGKKIAKKCKGLPLAAKMLGSTLKSEKSVDKWKDILNSELWELKEAKVDLFPHILLSYQELPAMIKHCFLILSIFPKDTELEVEHVVRIWMAHGFLNPTTNNDDKVNTGQKYLKFLVSCAFLEEKYTKILMHDIIHDFARHLLGDAVISYSVLYKSDSGSMSTAKGVLCPKSATARHLYIDGNIGPTSIGYVEKLHTCMMQCVPTNVTSDLVKGLKMVRILSLVHCGLRHLPQSIGKLIHLRLLDLSDNPLVTLPETIGGLYNLQQLFLQRTGLSTLPDSIGKLTNLIFLSPDDKTLERFPESVGKLINVQYLSRVPVEAGKSELGFLKDLNQLRGKLEIAFGSKYDDEVDVKKAAIEKKKHVTELRLDFNYKEVTAGVMTALQPTSGIQVLAIIDSCVSLPGWITSLHHLTDLNIYGASNCSTLPPLGELPSLETLSLSLFFALKDIGREFYGHKNDEVFVAFPNLLKLEIRFCESVKEWSDIKAKDEAKVTVMPKLRSLVIQGCRRLEVLPSRLLRRASLKELRCESISSSLAESINNDKQLWERVKNINIKGPIDESLGPNLRLSRTMLFE